MVRASLLSRRSFLVAAGGAAGAARAAGAIPSEQGSAPGRRASPFRFCFNTATIRGQKRTLIEEAEIAAKAGYDAIEPWIDKIAAHAAGGGSLDDARKRIADLGLTVEGAIGFARWIVDDEAERAKGLEGVARDMENVARIGGRRIAAPPAGAPREGLDLLKIADRYRALLDLGDRAGVVPALEVWGTSCIRRLGQAVLIAIETGHPKACLLPDVYHIYKGGSSFAGLRLLSAAAVPVFHINDYPADPPREKASDRDRVYPGDGVAPLGEILRDLAATGGPIVLSLELFSPDLWRQDPLAVARTGLAKMKAAVEKALGEGSP
ncbi:MAG: sugar phosphate isomerase/epimerase [Planctomycetes bacterium]|nr:sugar phosphate isomerase/epimerase [Planctomycetota bacterium]